MDRSTGIFICLQHVFLVFFLQEVIISHCVGAFDLYRNECLDMFFALFNSKICV